GKSPRPNKNSGMAPAAGERTPESYRPYNRPSRLNLQEKLGRKVGIPNYPKKTDIHRRDAEIAEKSTGQITSRGTTVDYRMSSLRCQRLCGEYCPLSTRIRHGVTDFGFPPSGATPRLLTS